MAIVGFGFTKMNVERKGDITGKINIKNNVSIKEVNKIDMSFGKAKQKALKISFEFQSVYEPGVAKISFEGNVVDLQDDKTVESLYKGWEKDNKLPDNMLAPIINSILNRCNVQALILSKELNLPPPIPMPKVDAQVAGKKE